MICGSLADYSHSREVVASDSDGYVHVLMGGSAGGGWDMFEDMSLVSRLSSC